MQKPLMEVGSTFSSVSQYLANSDCLWDSWGPNSKGTEGGLCHSILQVVWAPKDNKLWPSCLLQVWFCKTCSQYWHKNNINRKTGDYCAVWLLRGKASLSTYLCSGYENECEPGCYYPRIMPLSLCHIMPLSQYHIMGHVYQMSSVVWLYLYADF